MLSDIAHQLSYFVYVRNPMSLHSLREKVSPMIRAARHSGGDVEIDITIPGAEPELGSLLRALHEEPELHGKVTASRAEPDPTAMNGEVYALLTATITSPAAVYGLSRCVVTWLRFRRTKISVRLKTPDGLELTIDEESTKGSNITEVIESVNQALGGHRRELR